MAVTATFVLGIGMNTAVFSVANLVGAILSLSTWYRCIHRLPLNILHVCDYVAPYANYDASTGYAGRVVNCNVKLATRQISGQEIQPV